MSSSRSNVGGAVPGRPNPTQKLDQGLVERYKKDPAAFNRATTLNLLVALLLLAFAGILGYASIKLVSLSGGGLALDTMAIFPVLLALAALDEVRWRRALDKRGGVPLPPRPPLRAFVKKLLRGPDRTAAAPASAPSKPEGKGSGSS